MFGLANPSAPAAAENNAVFPIKFLTAGFEAATVRPAAAILPFVPNFPRILPAPTIAFLAKGDLAAIFFAPA